MADWEIVGRERENNPEATEEEDAQKDCEKERAKFVVCPKGKWLQTERVNSSQLEKILRVKCPGPPRLDPHQVIFGGPV